MGGILLGNWHIVYCKKCFLAAFLKTYPMEQANQLLLADSYRLFHSISPSRAVNYKNTRPFPVVRFPFLFCRWCYYSFNRKFWPKFSRRSHPTRKPSTYILVFIIQATLCSFTTYPAFSSATEKVKIAHFVKIRGIGVQSSEFLIQFKDGVFFPNSKWENLRWYAKFLHHRAS